MANPWELDWGQSAATQNPWELDWADEPKPHQEPKQAEVSAPHPAGGLPAWMETTHSYLDPFKVLTGKAGDKTAVTPMDIVETAQFALPAGKAPMRAPTEKQLFGAGEAGYKTSRTSPASLNGGALSKKMLNFQTGLRRAGQGPLIAPKTHSLLDDLQQGIYYSNGRGMDVNDYLTLRHNLQTQAQNFREPYESLAATKALRRLDNIFDQTSPLNFTGVNRQQLDQLRLTIKDSRDNFSAGFRSRTLTNKQTAVDLQANAANSGMNVDNKIRSKMGAMVNPDTPSGTSKAGRSGYSPDEIREMFRINEGGFGINAARDVGNMLGGGGGIGRIVGGGGIGGGIGFAVGGPVGAAIGAGVAPAVGFGLKAAENAAARNSLARLGTSVRLRSPLGAATKQGKYNENALAIKLLSLLNYLPEGQ